MNNPRTRRTQTFHQGRHARAAQPLVFPPAPAGQAVDQSDSAHWGAGSHVIHDIQQFQPRQLTVTVPTGYQQNAPDDWLSPDFPDSALSPSDTSGTFSPAEADATYTLPTYPFDDTKMDWKPAVIMDDEMKPNMYDPYALDNTSHSQPTVPITVDPQMISGDGASPPTYAGHSPTKVRSAHRKAIEEKSSIKRKNAEQRLSHAITARLGGTFVPGLANQLNQAAELLELDDAKIRRLEEENRVLRSRVGGGFPVDVKHPIKYT